MEIVKDIISTFAGEICGKPAEIDVEFNGERIVASLYMLPRDQPDNPDYTSFRLLFLPYMSNDISDQIKHAEGCIEIMGFKLIGQRNPTSGKWITM